MAIGAVTFSAVSRGTYVELHLAVSGATQVTVSRFDTNGRLIVVRGGLEADIVANLWSGYDFEAPQGVPLLYRATITDGTDVVIVDEPCDGMVDYGGDWLMPVGRVELGMNVNVEYNGVGVLDRPVIRDVVQVVNRRAPIVISWGRQMWNGAINFLTLEDGERQRFLSIMAYPIVMFAARPGFGFEEPVFASVGSVMEERTTGLGRETSRRWSVELQQIARPPAYYVPPPPAFTWQTRLTEGFDWGHYVTAGMTWFEFGGYE